MRKPIVNGDHLKATVVEVHYGPGESSPPHSHSCAVVGYVVEVALRTQFVCDHDTPLSGDVPEIATPGGK